MPASIKIYISEETTTMLFDVSHTFDLELVLKSMSIGREYEHQNEIWDLQNCSIEIEPPLEVQKLSERVAALRHLRLAGLIAYVISDSYQHGLIRQHLAYDSSKRPGEQEAEIFQTRKAGVDWVDVSDAPFQLLEKVSNKS